MPFKLLFSDGFHQLLTTLNSNDMKMKLLLKIALIALLIGGINTSCTKVIDVDLNSKDPQFVIEGFVTLGETTHQVKITKSLDIDQGIAFPTVDNAVVTLIDDLGASTSLNLVSPGVYECTGYAVSEGRTYTLTVSVDGKVFVASGEMMQDIPLSSVQTFDFAFGPDTIHAIVPLRQDIANVKNFFQFNLYNNHERVVGNFIQSDQYNDGNMMMEPLFADGINSGDTIDVVMFGIEETVYDYFYTLQQNEQGATPANPTSNFSGGCLGYFSVRTKDVGQIVILIQVRRPQKR